MRKRQIAIASPFIGDEEKKAVVEPLNTGWMTQGPQVAAFEKEFAIAHRVPYALATTSCTTALHLGLSALGLRPGDEVIVPAFTWVATANVVEYCGATPVFVDVDPETFNMLPQAVGTAVTERTKAVIPVHLFGLCADMDAIRSAVPKDVFLLEDAACAAGAMYRGRFAGSLGDAAAFSFHPRKIITTGEGGMLTTVNDDLHQHSEILRNHGATVSEEMRHEGPTPYLLPDFNVLGFNYRMTDMQAAVGRVQLQRLETLLKERREYARVYTEQLSEVSWLHMPLEPADYKHSYQSFVTRIAADAPIKRNDLMARLQEYGISTRPGTHAVTELGYYSKKYALPSGQFASAKRLQETTMAIPLHNRMSQDDYDYTISCILQVAKEL